MGEIPADRLAHEHVERHLVHRRPVGIDVVEGVHVGADMVDHAHVGGREGEPVVLRPQDELLAGLSMV